MTTPITKEWLQQTIAEYEANRDEIPFGLETNSAMELEAFKMALAAIDSEPVSFDALRDAVAEMTGGPAMEWCDAYKGHQPVPFINFNSLSRIVEKFRAAPPAPVVPGAYIRDERGRMMLNGVCEPKIGFGAGWNACRAAMLNHSEVDRDMVEPVSQSYKLPSQSSDAVNEAAWKLHDTLTEHGPLNGHQFNNLKGCFYEALKVAMCNSPVIPDGWQLVPVDATEKMLVAGLEEANPLGGLIDWDASRGDCNTREQVRDIFKAIIAAAPQQEVKP